MRRHWQPIGLRAQVSEPGGAPVKAAMLVEDWLVLRGAEGRAGVLDAMCLPHRACQLFGRNEDSGLRRLDHGWKMAVLGNVAEMVSLPAQSQICEKVKHKAYPTKEWGSFVWSDMAPQGEVPELTPPASVAAIDNGYGYFDSKLQEALDLKVKAGGANSIGAKATALRSCLCFGFIADQLRAWRQQAHARLFEILFGLVTHIHFTQNFGLFTKNRWRT